VARWTVRFNQFHSNYMSEKLKTLKGELVSGKKQIKVNLSLIEFEEDGCQIVYCPALDVSGYGKTETEAMNSFYITLGEFFQYTTNKETLASELKLMGWVIRKSRYKPMIPPPMSQLLKSNDNFSRIFNEHPFRKFDKAFDLPLACY
jgi:hypothetical protein